MARSQSSSWANEYKVKQEQEKDNDAQQEYEYQQYIASMKPHVWLSNTNVNVTWKKAKTKITNIYTLFTSDSEEEIEPINECKTSTEPQNKEKEKEKEKETHKEKVKFCWADECD
jgi:hypothetical protein